MHYRPAVLKSIISLLSLFALIALLMIALVPQVCFASEELESIEINLDEALDIPEGHEDDLYKNIDFVSITPKEQGKDLILLLKNEGAYTVYDWSVAFNADFKGLGISGAELVTDEQVLRFRNEEYFDALEPGELREICIKTDSDNHEVQFYRVYGVCDELSDEYVDTDYVQFIDSDGSAKLKTVDDGEDIYPERDLSNLKETDAGTERDINADVTDFDMGTYAVIGNDSRSLISNVNIAPYRSIANFRATWRTDRGLVRGFGTGFMIGERHMLTCAHCLYDADLGGAYSAVTVHFGQNGPYYSQWAIPIARNISSSYISRPVTSNDRACLIFRNPQNRGYFKLGYTSPFMLKKISMSVTGYPGDKKAYNPANPLWPKYYMYTAKGRINYIRGGILKYKIDTYRGESGAPVYTSRGFVYGIHCGRYPGIENYNAAAYIRPSIVNRYKRLGWVG